MANASRTVTIKIDADGNAYVSEIARLTDTNNKFTRDAQNGAEQTISAFTRLGASIVTFNQALELASKALGGIKNAFSALIDAASEQQDAQNKLAAALQTTGRQVPIARFTEFASAIQQTTRFGDEAVVSSVALLAQLTDLDEKGLQKAARGAVGLAAVLDKDLQSATLQVARALTGNAQGLQRVGIQIDETLPKQEQQRQILEKLGQLYGRAEADSRTYAGATAQLKNAVSDLAEEIGTPLINGLTGIARMITPLVQATLEWATKNRELVNTILYIVGAIGAGAAAAGLAGAISVLINYIATLSATIIALITNPVGLVAFLALIGVGAAAFLLMKNRVQEFTETLSKAGAEQGLKRLNDELERLQTLQSADIGKRDPLLGQQPSLEAGIAQRAAEIDALNKQITERQALVKQFDSQEFKGGQLPQILDKKGEDQALKNAQAVAELKKQIEQVNVAIIKASQVEDMYSQALHDAELAQIAQEQAEKITQAQKDNTISKTGVYINQLADTKIKLLEATEAANKHKDAIKILTREIEAEKQAESDLAAVLEASKKGDAELLQRKIDAIDLEQQLANIEGDRLAAIGLTSDAERVRLTAQIAYLQKIKEIEDATPGGKDTSARVAQIQLAQTQLQQLGVASVNIGQQISSTVSDIFTAAIQGTLKLSDIGKSLLAGVARTAGDFLTQILNKKLGFENILLTNMQGLPGQMNNALSQGVQSVGGGLLQNIFGGIGSFFGGGGGSIPIPGGSGGSVGGPVGGTSASGGGGFGGGIIGSIFSTIGSLWSTFSSTTLGATISAAISSFTTTVATTISSTLSTVAASFATIPIIGWIIAAVIMLANGIYRIIANQQERPNVKLSGTFSGISFDPTMDQFVPGDINVAIGHKSGIKKSQVGAIADNLQKRLVVLAQQWVDILNIFPDFIANDIQPALDETNARLNKNFANLKFSPGGSRSIQQELEAMSGPDGLVRFFDAFLPSLAHGFSSTLEHAGITGTDFTGFGGISPGFKFPQKDWDDFIKAIQDVAGLTSQLGSVGAGKFLSTSDISAAGSLFNQLFSVTDAATFTKAAAEIQDKLKPVTDFLQQSVQEASDLFGKGLIAAMQAVTASDANAAFLKNIGEGVRDKIFSGISEAFIASAQFSDLLAPIQQIIRQFTQDALTSGQVPDVGAFRQALLPAIEDISTRAQTLAPLIQALQSLGFDVTQALQSLIGTVADTAAAAATAAPSVTINIENFNRDDDPQSLARQIQDLLNGRTAP